MEDIKSAGLIICVLMVLMAYLKQMIPKGKMMLLMKVIISVFILLSIVNGVRNFKFGSFKMLNEYSYERHEEVWDHAADLVAVGLQKEFAEFLIEQKIDAEVLSVNVNGTEDQFEIEKVILFGADADTARNLLAGRYQIGIAYIEVKNE